MLGIAHIQIHRDLVPHAAAQQTVEGYSQCLSGQVPESHLHPADCGQIGSAHSADRYIAPEVVIDPFDVERVPAGKPGPEVPVDDVLSTRRARGFTGAADALVRVDTDKTVAGPAWNRRFDGRYL